MSEQHVVEVGAGRREGRGEVRAASKSDKKRAGEMMLSYPTMVKDFCLADKSAYGI